MASPAHVQIVVELELGAEPIRGRIGEPAVEFEGWLELGRTLEQARAQQSGGTPSTPEEMGT